MKRFIGLFIFISVLTPSLGLANPSCREFFIGDRIARFDSESFPATSGELSDGVPNSYDSLKSATLKSRAALSPNDRGSIDFWVNLKKNRPLTMNSVRVEKSANPEPKYESCGTCKYMLQTHIRSLVLPMLRRSGQIDSRRHLQVDGNAAVSSGKFVLVVINGEVVGSVKVLGAENYKIENDGYFDTTGKSPRSPTSTPSFLALRNVVNDKGELLLAAGGVYYVTAEFYRTKILPAVNEQGPYLANGGSYPAWSASRTSESF